jgi:hypothetical protein
MKVRIGRLVKVLSILGHATEGKANSHGFFEGGTELATPFEGSTSRKIAMKIPGASSSIGRGKRKTSRRHAGGDHLTVEFRSDGASVRGQLDGSARVKKVGEWSSVQA